MSKLICNFLLRDVSINSSSVGVLSRYSIKFDIIKHPIVKKHINVTKKVIKN